MPDLHVTSLELRELARSKPNAVAWQKASTALGSKHDGIQVLGVQLAGAWGGRRAVEVLRPVLERNLPHRYRTTVLNQVIMALARCVGAEDAPWVLDLCFLGPTEHQRKAMLPIVSALP